MMAGGSSTSPADGNFQKQKREAFLSVKALLIPGGQRGSLMLAEPHVTRPKEQESLFAGIKITGIPLVYKNNRNFR
jgi:hypothetical protein